MTRPVVGLDPSLAATGIATDAGQSTITTKPASSLTGQLARLRVITWSVSVEVPPGALVVIEGPGFSRMAQAGHHQLAGLWWQLADLLDARTCLLLVMSPSALKKFATGVGSAKKADLRMALYKRAGLDVADDNQVDAWWLRQAGLHLLGDPAALPLPKDQLAALGGLRGQLPPAS
ncbi:MAG: hypothetical protein QM753_06885 [Thermomicrobiales bacterium]